MQVDRGRILGYVSVLSPHRKRFHTSIDLYDLVLVHVTLKLTLLRRHHHRHGAPRDKAAGGGGWSVNRGRRRYPPPPPTLAIESADVVLYSILLEV